jgi:NADPH-dependent 2,4-dienoyl-CoA reductase/sulfur reductase-like enzyme
MAVERMIVVGGGIAGCSAALEAVKRGLNVTLIDEHPQSRQAMSLDTPYFYGAQLAAVLDDASVVKERVHGANDLLLACLDAGVEILTGTCCWGSFVPGSNNVNLKNAQLGVADGERSWLVEYDHLILATGSRDLVLSFPGWHLPGVLAANGVAALLARYRALPGNRMVILGSGNVGLRTARLALDKGVQVAAVVEVASEVRGDPALAADLTRAGVPFLLSHTVEQVVGEQDVRGIRVLPVDSSLQPVRSRAQEIACDTVCMAFGVVPNIELASVSGCRTVFDAARGGWVPEIDADFRTGIPSIRIVGDAAGVSEKMHLDPELAAEQGRRAARAIAGADDRSEGHEAHPVPREENPLLSGARTWLRSLVAAGGMDVVVCPCEAVTRRELLDLSPPKYLGAGNWRSSGGVTALPPSGQRSQDVIKRLTRAGTGHCQGKRCRDQVLMLLADATGAELSRMVPASYRVPVRPIPLAVMWAGEETEEMRRTWPIWLHPVEDGAPGYASGKAEEAEFGKR